MQPVDPSDDEGSDDEDEQPQDEGDDSESDHEMPDSDEDDSDDQEQPSDDEAADSDDETNAAQVERRKKKKNKKNKNKGNGGNDTPSGPVAPSDPSGSGNNTAPASTDGIDWRTQGVVNPIKNQGQCGSCWAFGSNAQMESLYAIKTGELYNLSEQQLVDCASKGNNGCNGGFMTNVFNYYSNKKSMMETSDYKYKGRQTSCKYDSSNASPV